MQLFKNKNFTQLFLADIFVSPRETSWDHFKCKIKAKGPLVQISQALKS